MGNRLCRLFRSSSLLRHSLVGWVLSYSDASRRIIDRRNSHPRAGNKYAVIFQISISPLAPGSALERFGAPAPIRLSNSGRPLSPCKSCGFPLLDLGGERAPSQVALDENEEIKGGKHEDDKDEIKRHRRSSFLPGFVGWFCHDFAFRRRASDWVSDAAARGLRNVDGRPFTPAPPAVGSPLGL